MRQSQLFTKTRKQAPKDEVSRNAELLIRAGYIHKEMAGAYALLPLGLRVMKKIEGIIREEMSAIGGQELEMTTLQSPELWQQSNRWDDDVVDNWFKTRLSSGAELGIANTHEEPITNMLKDHVGSYKDLPLYVYQFQTKFRNELRAKSGMMRGREFLMKDLYSFSSSEADFKKFYEQCALAYEKIFDRVGIGIVTFRTLAAGGSFTRGYTDEFQTISEAGEDIIYLDRSKGIAINQEIYDEDLAVKHGMNPEAIEQVKSIEVGNIFPLETKYSEAIGLQFKDRSGELQHPVMGSYGIGLGRLMGTVVEVLSDDEGIVWPESIAPFKVHVLRLGDSESVVNEADTLIAELKNRGVEVLYDDRDTSIGSKFNDADLIGIPHQIVISERSLENGGFEYRKRLEGEVGICDLQSVVELLC